MALIFFDHASTWREDTSFVFVAMVPMFTLTALTLLSFRLSLLIFDKAC